MVESTAETTSATSTPAPKANASIPTASLKPLSRPAAAPGSPAAFLPAALPRLEYVWL